jgi:TonB family protein
MRNRLVSIAAFFLAVAAAPGAPGKHSSSDAEALIKKARELSDIRAEGSPAFRLSAELSFPGVTDVTANQGSYVELWSSPDHWRKEIKGDGYEMVLVRSGDKLYRKASMPYPPWPVFRLVDLFRLGGEIPSPARVSKVHSEHTAHDSAPVSCVAETPKRALLKVTTCFGRDDGLLRSVENNSGRMEFESYATLGTKQFPKQLRWSFEGHLVAGAYVDSLDLIPPMPSGEFEPPQGAEVTSSCDEKQPPSPVSEQEPSYTSTARDDKIQGGNFSYVVINEQGDVIHAEIIGPLEPSLDAATLEAIKSWKFRPANCGGRPIAIGTVVRTTFHLF